MRNLKKWITTALLMVLLLPAMAQQKADSIYTFRFVAGDDMFYVPWSGNGEELNRLLSCVEQHKAAILDGGIPVEVDGYCTSQATADENLAMAKTRSNRVKTEMILGGGLTEACFTTRNHAAEGNYVTVRIVIPTGPSEAELEAQRKAEAERLEAEKRAEQQRLAEDQRRAEEQQKAEKARQAAEQAEAERLAAEQQAEAGRLNGGKTARTDVSGWYVGLQGGVPFGVSQFSSFGADKTRAGWTAGIHGGYRFNRVLSLEAQAAWGEVNLAQRECCIPDNYWLGTDGARYYAPVFGLEGWDYAALTSCVTMQRYGLQLNADVLGLFPATRGSRWSVEVSPLLAAVGTKASLSTLDGAKATTQGSTAWHLGVGGNIQAGYRFDCGMGVGIYSGITYLTGNGMDGLPKSGHKANYVWESGIRLNWFFTTSTRKEASK